MSTTPIRIDPPTLAQRLATGSAVVLDVRTPGEHAASAILGSQLLPLDQLDQHADTLAANLNAPVTLVCRSGQRATQAHQRLTAAGATDLTVLDGGLNAWQAAGQPVHSTPGASTWEMERQVRLAAGSLVLGGILASLRWSAARFLSGAVGAGLTYAALSNTCAMSRVLLKLPYNRERQRQAGHRHDSQGHARIDEPPGPQPGDPPEATHPAKPVQRRKGMRRPRKSIEPGQAQHDRTPDKAEHLGRRRKDNVRARHRARLRSIARSAFSSSGLSPVTNRSRTACRSGPRSSRAAICSAARSSATAVTR